MRPKFVWAGADDLHGAARNRLPVSGRTDIAVHHEAARRRGGTQRIDGTVVADRDLARLARNAGPCVSDVMVDVTVGLHGPDAVVRRDGNVLSRARHVLPVIGRADVPV